MSSSDSDSPEPDIDDIYDRMSNGVASVPNQAVTPSDVTPSDTNGAGILQGAPTQMSQDPIDTISSTIAELEKGRGDQHVRQ